MIKIHDHVSLKKESIEISDLAEKHWLYLNPKLKNKSDYKKISLIEKCKKYACESRSNNYTKMYARNSKIEAKRHSIFFEYLLENKYEKLKSLIIGEPTELAKVKKEIMKILYESDLYIRKENVVSQTDFGNLLSKKIFNYEAYRSSVTCKEHFINLNFESSTCPYCNDNNVQVINIDDIKSKEKRKLALLDLDHFYPKAKNPFFAVSFYNLIHTCHDCNSRIKSDKDFSLETHIHPFHEAFDDFYTFRVSLSTLLDTREIQVEVVSLPSKIKDKTSQDLLIPERYSSKSKIEEAESLIEYFNKYKHRIGTEAEDMFLDSLVHLYKIPTQKNEILGIRLGKLKRDILKQIDVQNVLKLQS